MTTRLDLIAHASTDAVRATRFALDEPIDARGAVDAGVAMAPLLGGRGRLLCGSERRCRETAGLGAVVHARLDEWDLGAWAGRTWADVAAEDAAAAQAWMADPAFAGHGGESLLALLARVEGWLAEVAQAPELSGRVVAVTSPAVVRAAVVSALSAPPTAFWRIDVAPLAGVSLGAYAGRWNLRL